MVLFPEVSPDQRLHRHAHAVHHDAELDQADDHGEGDQAGLAKAARDEANHHIVHQAPADIDGGIHDAVARREQKVPEGQVPDKAQRVFLAEVVPEAGEDAEAVPDHRTQDDARHSEEPGQYDGADDVPADLKSVADVVAQLVSVAVDHLFQIKDDDGQEGVDRNQTVVLKRILQNIARDAARLEIGILKHENQKR